jgi:hypothetical protein
MRLCAALVLCLGCYDVRHRVGAGSADGPAADADRTGTDGPDNPGSGELVADADTWLDPNLQNVANGMASLLEVSVGGFGASVALVRFDLRDVPAEAVVTGARLELFVNDGAQDVEVYELLEAWSEGAATWQLRHNDVFWSGTGASGGSRDSQPLATGSLVPNTVNTFDLRLDLIDRWRADPAANHGIAILAVQDDSNPEDPPPPAKIDSREAVAGESRPRLLLDAW